MKLKTVKQPQKGYRHGIDAYLLAAFSLQFPCDTWCDLGTGSGIIPALLIAGRPRCLAIERQPTLAAFALSNLADLDCECLCQDVRQVDWQARSIDLFVCNPPYFAEKEGRLNRDPQKAAARHALHGDWIDFLHAIQPACHPESRFCAVLPYGQRVRQRKRVHQLGWHNERHMVIRSFRGQLPVLECFSLNRKNANKRHYRGLTLFCKQRVYTRQAQQLLRPFVRAAHDRAAQQVI